MSEPTVNFLYSAFYAYTSQDVMAFLEEAWNVPRKTERGDRVFPLIRSICRYYPGTLEQLLCTDMHVHIRHPERSC